MYVKIPHNLGVNNINLTLDYLQEEDSTQKVEEKEEDNNSFSTSFDLYSKILVTNIYGALVYLELDIIYYDLLVFMEISCIPMGDVPLIEIDFLSISTIPG